MLSSSSVSPSKTDLLLLNVWTNTRKMSGNTKQKSFYNFNFCATLNKVRGIKLSGIFCVMPVRFWAILNFSVIMSPRWVAGFWGQLFLGIKKTGRQDECCNSNLADSFHALACVIFCNLISWWVDFWFPLESLWHITFEDYHKIVCAHQKTNRSD